MGLPKIHPLHLPTTFIQKLSQNPDHIYLTRGDKCVLIHTMDSRTIIKILKRNGWREVARAGSHAQFRHPDKKGRVTVPHPKRDIPVGTLKSIERQSGLKFN
jgi:predicted RNA binding protein YcfA (HicA-like mRNA interferase family)